MKFLRRFSVLLIAILAVASHCRGQYDAAVTGTGYVDIERAPNIMRMQIMMQSKAETTEDALQALSERIEAALATLESTGADKKSIIASDPALVSGDNDRMRQMQRMMMQMRRARGDGRTDEQPALPAYVTLSSTVAAEWTLKGKTSNELIIEASALQQQVREADLAGTKEGRKLTPEEQEIMEELEANGGGFNPFDQSEEEGQPGQPSFMFVSKISTEEHSEALAEAFKKAEQKAKVLAQAAGAELGALKSLADQSQSLNTDMMEWGYAYGYGSTRYATYPGMARNTNSDPDTPEAVGQQPTKVTYRVTISASFGLK